jgi:endogenous inhibitor of DNA gyrase (YacG/DUF329 family)
MKILKQGALPEEKVYRSKCHHCKTEFEYQQKEAKLTHDQRDGSFLTIACPFCQRQVTENHQ